MRTNAASPVALLMLVMCASAQLPTPEGFELVGAGACVDSRGNPFDKYEYCPWSDGNQCVSDMSLEDCATACRQHRSECGSVTFHVHGDVGWCAINLNPGGKIPELEVRNWVPHRESSQRAGVHPARSADAWVGAQCFSYVDGDIDGAGMKLRTSGPSIRVDSAEGSMEFDQVALPPEFSIDGADTDTQPSRHSVYAVVGVIFIVLLCGSSAVAAHQLRLCDNKGDDRGPRYSLGVGRSAEESFEDFRGVADAAAGPGISREMELAVAHQFFPGAQGEDLSIDTEVERPQCGGTVV
eukprot:Hpha_TRINITY_DN22996_c0_g1::TRINITY_DN22996_c0_g1_i1::g.153991::m.153991